MGSIDPRAGEASGNALPSFLQEVNRELMSYIKIVEKHPSMKASEDTLPSFLHSLSSR